MLRRLIISLLILMVAGGVCAQEKIHLTNGEWPPYLSSELPYYGVASRIVSEAFSRIGIKVEYDFFPWSRAYEMAKIGEWDGSLIWSYSTERERFFYFSDPIVIRKMVLFHMKNYQFDWCTMADLRGIPIGATLGYYYGKAFEEAEKSGLITVIWIPYDELNLKKLYHDRIKLFAGDLLVTPTMIKKHFTIEQRAMFTHHDRPLDVGGYHLMLSRKKSGNKELMARFNQSLNQLRASGVLDRYLAESIRQEP